MKVKTIISEDFTNYKNTSMFIGTCYCDWKCAKDGGFDCSICQNSKLAQEPNIEIDSTIIIEQYLNNPLTSAIVFGGLEPFLQFEELYEFIFILRNSYKCHDEIVIYTGYKEQELCDKISQIQKFDNIVIKFGRYVPNNKKHYDSILGIELASDNQYAVKIS